MFTSFIKKVALAGGLATAAIATTAAADYPEKPITMVIPFGAGGSHDLNARVITSTIPTYLEQAMIVRLTPGAGGQKRDPRSGECAGRWVYFAVHTQLC